MVQLSVLDQSIAVADRPQAEAIRESVSLAEYCEELVIIDIGFLNITIIQPS